MKKYLILKGKFYLNDFHVLDKLNSKVSVERYFVCKK